MTRRDSRGGIASADSGRRRLAGAAASAAGGRRPASLAQTPRATVGEGAPSRHSSHVGERIVVGGDRALRASDDRVPQPVRVRPATRPEQPAVRRRARSRRARRRERARPAGTSRSALRLRICSAPPDRAAAGVDRPRTIAQVLRAALRGTGRASSASGGSGSGSGGIAPARTAGGGGNVVELAAIRVERMGSALSPRRLGRGAVGGRPSPPAACLLTRRHRDEDAAPARPPRLRALAPPTPRRCRCASSARAPRGRPGPSAACRCRPG